MFKWFTNFFKPKRCISPKFKAGDSVQFNSKAPKIYRNIKTTIETILWYRDDGIRYKVLVASNFIYPEELLLNKI